MIFHHNKTTATGKCCDHNHEAVAMVWMGELLECCPTSHAINAATLARWQTTCFIDGAGDTFIGLEPPINPHDFADLDLPLIRPAFLAAALATCRAAELKSIAFQPEKNHVCLHL